MLRCAVLLMFRSNFTRGKKLFDPSTNVPYKTPVVHNYATFFFTFPFFFFLLFFAPTSKEGLVFTAPVQMRGKTWPYWQNWHKLSFLVLSLNVCMYMVVRIRWVVEFLIREHQNQLNTINKKNGLQGCMSKFIFITLKITLM